MKEYARGIKPTTNKKQLVQLLTKTQEDGAKKIAKAGELHMLQLITRFDGVPGSRLAWMNHGISHEEYHRGQLALYARLVGRVPALTQLIYGKKAGVSFFRRALRQPQHLWIRRAMFQIHLLDRHRRRPLHRGRLRRRAACSSSGAS